MRAFTTAGMVGTAQTGGEMPASGAPSESLVGAMGGTDLERAYLLRAGAAAVCQAAGYMPTRVDQASESVSDEPLPRCNSTVELLIESLLGDHRTALLIEALDLLRRSGQALSPILLPPALDTRAPELRAAISPVLGARGRWLSQFNPAWKWAAQTLADTSRALPADAETLWQEGAAGQRVELLGRLRAFDPNRAREWLMETWKREKADTRADLLKTFATGLSLADEPLLESTLDDRAATVRAVAVDLLARLPESAFAGRMRERAMGMLVYANGKLEAKPPTQLPPDWQRDGAGQQSSTGRGERASWLTRVVSMVPCAVWSERFGQPPETLIVTASESHWRDAVLDGWTQAAARHRDAAWSLVLWRYWSAPRGNGAESADRDALRDLLAPHVPLAELEAYAAGYFTAEGNPGSASFIEALAVISTPWSAAFGNAYLAALRAFVAALDPSARDVAPWNETPEIAALAIPPACFETALEPLELPESGNWYVHNFRGQLGTFADTIRLRKQLYEEIPLP
ncbi:MAG TPA: DUF5691 domain-containing protein [Ktedonobacterales bacterium]|nr:DUF5691 domain-containing protein [Ktedonobacterales bacterium]